MDGYLFFDDVTPARRDALFDLVDEELLTLGAVSVSGSAGAFVAYQADDPQAAYATVEAVVDAVGRPSQRLLVMTPETDLDAPRPGRRAIADETTVALVLLPVPLSRAAEVARVVVRALADVAVALVLGGQGTVLVELDDSGPGRLEARLADVLAIAGVETADVMVTSGALGRGWGGTGDEPDAGGSGA